MLTDHKVELTERAARHRVQRQTVDAYTNFISGLTAWSWFITLTFRDSALTSRKALLLNSEAEMLEDHSRAASLDIRKISQSQRDFALARVTYFLNEVQAAAGTRIGFVLGEETGALGRLHFHGLISDVNRLNRDDWEVKAQQRFGSARFCRYDPSRRGSGYIAKAAADEERGVHFGGVLAGVDLSRTDISQNTRLRGIEIATSPALSSDFFRLTLKRRHR